MIFILWKCFVMCFMLCLAVDDDCFFLTSQILQYQIFLIIAISPSFYNYFILFFLCLPVLHYLVVNLFNTSYCECIPLCTLHNVNVCYSITNLLNNVGWFVYAWLKLRYCIFQILLTVYVPLCERFKRYIT